MSDDSDAYDDDAAAVAVVSEVLVAEGRICY